MTAPADSYNFDVDVDYHIPTSTGAHLGPGGVRTPPSGRPRTLVHPGVAAVAVVGVPHETLGEEVKAFVVLAPGAAVTPDELVTWCRERVAAFKYPRIVEFVPELPLTATGKIVKRALREA
ncbi:MAG: long-chain acyl-CoA synthetase [Mycobacteriales bacterium]